MLADGTPFTPLPLAGMLPLEAEPGMAYRAMTLERFRDNPHDASLREELAHADAACRALVARLLPEIRRTLSAELRDSTDAIGRARATHYLKWCDDFAHDTTLHFPWHGGPEAIAPDGSPTDDPLSAWSAHLS